jgi:hypothetical protein
VTPEEYHKDLDGPTLSQSTAHTLIARSPYHAWLYHPRLGGKQREATKEMDLGAIVHELLLGKGRGFAVAEWSEADSLAEVVEAFEGGELIEELAKPAKKPRAKKPVDPPPLGPEGKPEWQNWLRKDAQAARKAIEAAGMVAMLPKEKRIAESLAKRIRERLASQFGITLDGQAECPVYWEETTTEGEPVKCRGMLDLWSPKDATIYDLKIVRSAHPRAALAHVLEYGGDIQSAAYTRAIERTIPALAGRVKFVFLFCEVSSGAVTPVAMGGTLRELGARKWRRAVDTWARCLAENHWPTYTDRTLTLDAPPWALTDELENAFEQRFATTKGPSENADSELDANF